MEKLPDFTIRTGDGQTVTIPSDLARCFGALADSCEGTKHAELDLLEIDSATLKLMLDYTKARLLGQETALPLPSNITALLDLAEKAKYVGCDDFEAALCPRLAQLIRGATPLQTFEAELGKLSSVARTAMVDFMAEHCRDGVALVKMVKALMNLEHLQEPPQVLADMLLGRIAPSASTVEEAKKRLPWGQWVSPITLAEYGFASVLRRIRWERDDPREQEDYSGDPLEFPPSPAQDLLQILIAELTQGRPEMLSFLAEVNWPAPRGEDPLGRLLNEQLEGAIADEKCDRHAISFTEVDYLEALHQALLNRNYAVLEWWANDSGLRGKSRIEVKLALWAIKAGDARALDIFLPAICKQRERNYRADIVKSALRSGSPALASIALERANFSLEEITDPSSNFEFAYFFEDPRITPPVAEVVEKRYQTTIERLIKLSTPLIGDDEFPGASETGE